MRSSHRTARRSSANEEGHEVIVGSTSRRDGSSGSTAGTTSRVGARPAPHAGRRLPARQRRRGRGRHRELPGAGDRSIARRSSGNGVERASARTTPPSTYGDPNGDTPLPDGGLLITEIQGSRVVRLDAAGSRRLRHPRPDRLPVGRPARLAKGNVLVVDYANPGAILRVNRHGHVLWRYAPRSGRGRLDHPSLAIDLAERPGRGQRRLSSSRPRSSTRRPTASSGSTDTPTVTAAATATCSPRTGSTRSRHVAGTI